MSKLRVVLVTTFAMVMLASGAADAKKKASKEPAAKQEAPAAPAAPVEAAAAAEVTLKGTMMCGKCSLKQADACQNVLKVGEGAKAVHYWLEANELSKTNHAPVCSATKPATVTGTVSDKDGKKNLTASAIKYE